MSWFGALIISNWQVPPQREVWVGVRPERGCSSGQPSHFLMEQRCLLLLSSGLVLPLAGETHNTSTWVVIYIYSSVNLNWWPQVWLLFNSRSWFTNTRLFGILYIIVTLASFLHSLSLSHPSWFNLETDEYLEKSFNTNLAALLWTISSLEILCLVDGDHTGEAYSRTDLTIEI